MTIDTFDESFDGSPLTPAARSSADKDSGRHSRPDEDHLVIVEEDIEVAEPPMYKVVMLNDDYTTMEFVVHILETVFHRSRHDAESIMSSIHESGSGTAGIFTKEVAETKVAIVHHLARQNEFPLKCILEAQT